MKEHEYQCPYKSDPVQPTPGLFHLYGSIARNYFFFVDFTAFHPELAQKALMNTPRPPPVQQQQQQILPPSVNPNQNGLRSFYEQNMREMQLNILRATNPALAAHFPALGLPGLQNRPQLPQLRAPFSLPQLNQIPVSMHQHLNVCIITISEIAICYAI